MTLVLILYIVVIIGLLVTIHEFGHFIAARSLGVAVRQFAIGFGPSLWKRQWRGTEWQINVIPLGGYNAFPDDEGEAAAGDRSYLGNRTVRERGVIVVAGVAMNLVIGYLVFVLMFFCLGIPIDEARLLDVLPGSAAMQAGLKAGDLVVGVDGWPIHTQQEVGDYVHDHKGRPLRLLVDRDGKRFTTTLTVRDEVRLYGVSEDSPAEQAGLQRGDLIAGANGRPIHTQQAMRELVRSHAGEPLQLDIERHGKHLAVSVTPSKRGILGVQFADPLFIADPLFFDVLKAHMRPIDSVLEPFAYGGAYFYRTTLYMGIILEQLFTGGLPWQDVGGPVMAVHQGVKLAQVSFKNLFFYSAMLSIDLALINILPLPALDGGHLLLLFIEMLRGRRLPKRLEEGILQTGLLVLLGLGILLLFKDVISIAGGHG